MPNIHIHCHDQADAGLIVAEILALVGGRVRLTVDNNDQHDVGGRPVAARAATETGRRIVETITMEERRQRELVKRERYLNDEENYAENLLVVCATCGAGIHEACHKASGKEYKRPYVHSLRRHHANEAATSRTKPHRTWRPCMCGHSEEVHAETGDRPCLVKGLPVCDCPSFTATSPFKPVILDEV